MTRDTINEFKRRGINVPDDIAITSFDDTEKGHYITQPLTTVNQPIHKLGEEAFNILLCLLNKEKVTYKIEIPADLVIHRSCGCFVYPGLKAVNESTKSKKSRS